MIRTLRITSIIAGILAVSLIVPFGVYGVQGDSEVKELLSSPSIVEQYKKAAGDNNTEAQNRKDPLEEMADVFANHINPPRPVETSAPQMDPRNPIVNVKPRAKFKLLGTSYNPADPGLSIALIDNPGDGLFWVRPSQQIGHTLIKEIKDGAIVYEDGQGVQEMAVEQLPTISLIDTPGSSTSIQRPSQAVRTNTETQRPSLSVSRDRKPIRPTRITQGQIKQPVPPKSRPIETEEDARELENIVSQLRDLKDNMDVSERTPEERENDEQARAELMEQLIHLQQVRASRVNQQEEDPNN